jgi:hypothetical protein
LTRASSSPCSPVSAASQKIASTGEVVGIVSQDRATTIASARARPVHDSRHVDAELERARKSFHIGIVRDQLFTPLLAYVAILNTLTSYERQNGVATYALKGAATLKKYGKVDFEDLFTGDQPSVGAAASVVAPINLLMRNAFEDVDIESLNLEIDASEQPRSATLERVWVDAPRVKAGGPATLKVLLRTYRGDDYQGRDHPGFRQTLAAACRSWWPTAFVSRSLSPESCRSSRCRRPDCRR